MMRFSVVSLVAKDIQLRNTPRNGVECAITATDATKIIQRTPNSSITNISNQRGSGSIQDLKRFSNEPSKYLEPSMNVDESTWQSRIMHLVSMV